MSRQPGTIAVRAGIETDPTHGAVTPPLFLSSNFAFRGFDDKRDYDYTRSGNPTRDLLGTALADLEGGAGGVVTSSGMSAIHLVLQLLDPGDLVLAPHDCYGGTWRLLTRLADRGLFRVEFVDQGNARALDNGFAKKPKLVWVENPSNPLLRLVDLDAIATRAHAAGAVAVADNTFFSPILQRPLEHGFDVVVHSTTKYLNGHSDVVGGVAIAKTPELHEQLSFWANCLGLTGSPFDSFLTLRGLRTLDVRMRIHQENTTALVALCEAHPAIARVHYPGRGGVFSFALAADVEVPRFLERLRCFTLAESVGGVESLIAHPATMTHAAMTPEAQATAGITPQLLRVSVGIEAIDDLCSDLSGALQASSSQTPVDAAS